MHVGAVTNGYAGGAELFDACCAALSLLLQKMLMLELFESVEHRYLHKGGRENCSLKVLKANTYSNGIPPRNEAVSRRSRGEIRCYIWHMKLVLPQQLGEFEPAHF